MRLLVYVSLTSPPSPSLFRGLGMVHSEKVLVSPPLLNWALPERIRPEKTLNLEPR